MKKIISFLIGAQLLLIPISSAFSASDKCEVKQVKGSSVVLECGKKSGNFKVKDKVKIKSMRTKSVEGC